MAQLIQKSMNKDFSYQSFTHQQLLITEVFDSCCFSHCDMNFSFFRNKRFIKCDFRHADIGGTEFENCDFLDCAFEYTNLTNTAFIGCHIKNSVPEIIDKNQKNVPTGIYRSSCSNLILSGSSNRRSYISTVILKDLGLRECDFSKTDFVDIDFSSISLEDSKFIDCRFERLGLMSNNVKGLKISNCEIQQIEITFEKLLSLIGIDFIFQCQNVKIYLDSRSSSPAITSIHSLIKESFNSTKINLRQTGAIFEYVNLSILECIANNNQLNINVINEILEEFIHFNTGKPIPPHNFLSLMELLVHFQLNSVAISNKLRELASLVIKQRMSEKHKAMLFYKLEKLTHISVESHMVLEVTDYSSSFTLESRKELAEFINLILSLSQVTQSNSLLQRSGSVIEQILIQTKDLIDNFWQLTFLLTLLGFRFKKEFKNGVILEFSLIPSFLSPKAKNKQVQVSSEIQQDISSKLTKNGVKLPQYQTPVELSNEEIKTFKKIKAMLNNKEINISIKKAAVKELTNNENIKALLLQKDLM